VGAVDRLSAPPVHKGGQAAHGTRFGPWHPIRPMAPGSRQCGLTEHYVRRWRVPAVMGRGRTVGAVDDLQNPYRSPRVGPASPASGRVPFAQRAVLASGLLLPFLIPIGFYHAYQPVNEAWTVTRFGCGCPSLDGTYHFNANHFNLILVGVLDLLCIPWWVRSARRTLPEQARLPACILGSVVILFISLRVLGRMFWL
jgi:hypothetical protein